MSLCFNTYSYSRTLTLVRPTRFLMRLGFYSQLHIRCGIIWNGSLWPLTYIDKQVARDQVGQDDAVRDLLESLREMAGAASSFTDLPEIDGTVDVIQEIGRASLDAALIIREYTNFTIKGKGSLVGLYRFSHLTSPLSRLFCELARAVKNSVSDISSRMEECQKRCADLTVKLDRRIQIDTNRKVVDTNARVKGVQDDQKSGSSTFDSVHKLMFCRGAHQSMDESA